MFRRRAPVRPEPDLPLSTFQARRLYHLVADAFAQAGVVVEVFGDHAVDERGRAYGLRDLAAACATESPAAWPEVVRRHVHAEVSPVPTLADLDDATLRSSSVLRLLPAALLPPDWDPFAEPVTDDLVSVVAIDLGDQALMPPADALRERAPLLPWRERAADNLRDLAHRLPLHHERVSPQEAPDEGFDVVVGESGLVASLALQLDALLDRLGAGDGLPAGIGPVQSVLVEAGPGLATALLAQDLVDRVLWFIAPKLVGEGTPAVGDLGTARMADALAFVESRWETVGADALLHGFLRPA
ncbi:dihydrofolate reductase family protein [uncultured Nocardioides sp.]|uniref:dihydrofolate reductase family protein n=1 Tax=uncultured Nocardioides sp. TaxID=198441 RepID=UPI0026118BD5|nr:dihydrofolate reductase family protein [uncultured Nocardioides sp.]